MKKSLLAIILMLGVLLCGRCYAYDLEITGTCVDVENNGKVIECNYTSAVSVVQGADKVFLISTPNEFGNIIYAQFNSTSDNCDVWADESDGAAAKAITNIFYWVDIDEGYGQDIANPRYFRNTTAGVKGAYFTISPQSATGTGTWYLKLFFGPNNLY